MDSKRLVDIGVSACGLVLAAPVIALAAVAVRLDSPGSVLFRQERIGMGFRPFRILKFRTMVADQKVGGPQITSSNDRRITRVGRFLRGNKLDELPQLWNVLVGEMSLVGPRPEVAKYVERFSSDYAAILSVRPGLTDLASLKYRREEEILAAYADPERAYVETILPAKIALAREYVAKASLRFDLRILVRTIAEVLIR